MIRRRVAARRFAGVLLAAGCAAALLAAGACAGTRNYQATKLADGSWNIRCESSLANCLSQAEDVCKGMPYEVLGARDQRDRYGPEVGTAQVEVRRSEANIRCTKRGAPLLGFGNDDPPLPNASGTNSKLPPPPARDALPPAPAPRRACVPGATQACIGPGKCEGGQSCLPDGSGFGPCDCGTIGPPPTAPSGDAGAGSGTGGSSGAGGRAGSGGRSGSGGRGSAGRPPPPPDPGYGGRPPSSLDPGAPRLPPGIAGGPGGAPPPQPMPVKPKQPSAPPPSPY